MSFFLPKQAPVNGEGLIPTLRASGDYEQCTPMLHATYWLQILVRKLYQVQGVAACDTIVYACRLQSCEHFLLSTQASPTEFHGTKLESHVNAPTV